MNKNLYDESSIQVLDGLRGVRKRPSMYIGSTDKNGLHHLVWEILDNAIDEVIAKYCTEIKVNFNLELNQISISDNGRGIPVGKHKTGVNTAELIFSKLHAGGKFGSIASGYKISGGLHGVGSSVVNALSSSFEAEISRDGFLYSVKFEKGKLIQPLTVIKATKLSGTKITFIPDKNIFGNLFFSISTISERLKECAYLNSGLKIIFNYETGEKKFLYIKGIEAFILDFNKDKNTLFEPITILGELNDVKIDITLQYNNEYNENILSFANNIKTTDGGVHVSAFKNAILRAIITYIKKENLLKNTVKIEASDIREGLTAIISVWVPEKDIEYEGQTKTKLASSKVKRIIENFTYEKFILWLQANKVNSKKLINKVMIAYTARSEAKKAKEMVRLGKSNKSKKIKILSGKLTPAYSKNKKKCEIFLVEGDSAGGSAKLGRNKEFQAILPLKGKIINAIRTSEIEILSNNEIQVIINSIGAGIGNSFIPEESNYGKIIIMTDADNDGAHIQILLLSFFYKYMRKLFEQEMIYIATPPLYKLKSKNINEYFWSDQKLKEKLKSLNKESYYIQRYKGLGEMNYEQLWQTTMNPNSRKLIKISLEDGFNASESINTLMGKETIKRKEWILDNINFDDEDNFLAMKIK